MCLFQTTLIGSGSSAGIEVPPEVIDELGAGKRRTGLGAGDRAEVSVVLDTTSRTPTLPDDLAVAFAASPGTGEAFARLPAGKQRRLVEHVLQAKAADTRARRIERAVADLSPSAAVLARRANHRERTDHDHHRGSPASAPASTITSPGVHSAHRRRCQKAAADAPVLGFRSAADQGDLAAGQHHGDLPRREPVPDREVDVLSLVVHGELGARAECVGQAVDG